MYHPMDAPQPNPLNQETSQDDVEKFRLNIEKLDVYLQKIIESPEFKAAFEDARLFGIRVDQKNANGVIAEEKQKKGVVLNDLERLLIDKLKREKAEFFELFFHNHTPSLKKLLSLAEDFEKELYSLQRLAYEHKLTDNSMSQAFIQKTILDLTNNWTKLKHFLEGEKDYLALNLHHDLKTLISPILMSVEYLMRVKDGL